MKKAGEIVLEAPGQGLPGIEALIARRMVPWMARIRSRKSFRRLFGRERESIMRFATDISSEQGMERILVKRIRGMEDSSRHWSVYMTLQHLQMVNTGIAGVLRALSQGQEVGRETRIEDVKPEPHAGVEQLERFQKSADLFEKTAESLVDLDLAATHDHPWFGPMNPKGWYGLAAVHMGIHRKQIEMILAGLK